MKMIASALAFIALLPASALAQESLEQGGILSAFFGLDDSRQIRVRTLPLCRGLRRGLREGFQGVPGNDGMPVIFSHEVQPDTLNPADFQIRRVSGEIVQADCVTLLPANDPGELRTALVVGEYGSADDQPATVEIVGDILSLDGRRNFLGAQADVIPLEAGPTLILAETVPQAEWNLGARGECPAEGVRNIVRAVWVGGITKPGGDEIDEQEMQLYRVDVRRADGSIATVAPLAVGDLNDNDNNHDLCLSVAGEPIGVFFPGGALTDPNEDLNTDTHVAVSGQLQD